MVQLKIERQAIIRHGDLVIDTQCFSVMLADREISLCPKEFATLFLLAEHPRWVFTKEQIYKVIYGEENAVNVDNTIYCLMYGLRKKMKSDSKEQKFIQTIKGVGYKFVVPDE